MFGYVPIRLEELALIKARIGWQGLTKQEYLDSGDYYLITGTDFKNGEIDFKSCHYVSKSRFDQDKYIQVQNGDVLVTKDGTLGKVAMVKNMDKPATLNAGVFVVRPLYEDLDNRYLYHLLSSSHLMNFAKKRVTGGTIKHLNQNIIIDFPVPLISLAEQKQIVSILDRFDKLCNDISKGLPAEIETRQKQYEYYRDKLLSFKPLNKD